MKGAAMALRLLLLVFGLPVVLPAQTGQCVSPTLNCTEFLAVATAGRVLVFRNQSLTIRDADITQIVVVIHGAERDAGTSFRIASAAAVLSGRIENTLIVAPKFSARVGTRCTDEIATDELNWECDVALGDWRSGGSVVSGAAFSSFQALDAIVAHLEDPQLFPNLRSVVVAGHSAGGQFVTNYQMTNRIHEGLRVRPTYVTANASVYAYPDQQRPSPVALTTCPSYADWPFGTSARTGYVGQSTSEELLKRAVERPVRYLVGESDTQPLVEGFYGSCAAQAQGPTRRERGENFGRYMSERYKARQAAIVVPGCAHSERCMFMSPLGVEALFPKGF